MRDYHLCSHCKYRTGKLICIKDHKTVTVRENERDEKVHVLRGNCEDFKEAVLKLWAD